MLFFKSSEKLDSSSCSKDLHYTVGKMEPKNTRGKQPETYDVPSKKTNSIIRPFSRQNVLYYYVPALGTASYTILSINVLNPSLRCRLNFGITGSDIADPLFFFPKRDLTNVLLATTLFGTGCYLYSRPHVKGSTKNGRYGFSAMGSIMFNFSSVLLWAILRSILPENVAVCSAAGLASSYILIKGATNYIEFVDNKISL